MEDPPEPPAVEASGSVPAPRVLIVDLSARFGGASARALGLLSGLAPGEAALAALEGTAVAAAARRAGLAVHPVARSKTDPRIALRLRRLLATGFGVVDAQNPQSKLWASLAAVGLPVAVVSTLNSWYLAEHGGRAKGRLYHELERLTARNVDLFIAVAPEIRDGLLGLGLSPERIALIPNAVAIDPATINLDPLELRRSSGLPSDIPVCCAVGRLVEAKAYDTLVDAIGLLAQDGRSVGCMVVGEGHLRRALEAQIARLGLGQLVRLVGFRDRATALACMKAADVFVLSSRTEGTPLAILEAAALGRPIVACRVGGIPTILDDGIEAVLVPPDEPRALASAIARLLERPADAARLGAAARSRVERDFNVRSQVAATREAYRRAWERRRGWRGRPVGR